MSSFFRHPNYYRKKLYFLSSIRMSGKNIIFDGNKSTFYKNIKTKKYLV